MNSNLDGHRFIFVVLVKQAIMNARRTWTEQEDRTIQDLVQRFGQKNWASIACQLSAALNIPPRSGKQCRQRWHNHLNPHIEKKVWSKAEQEKMFTLHQVYGNKWTVIAESLPGRTDNAIKNYFYSTIRRSLRRMGKFVGSKNSTEQMKNIKPSTLSKIFETGSQLSSQPIQSGTQTQLIDFIRENCETVRSSIIKFTNYKPKRNDKACQQERKLYEDVINKMVQINEIYQKVKGTQKRRRCQEMTFQKGQQKYMLSDDSFNDQSQFEQIREEDESCKKKQKGKQRRVKETSIKDIRMQEDSIMSIKEQLVKKEVADDKSVEGNSSHKKPTVILKSQQKLPSEGDKEEANQLGNIFEHPDFMIELKDYDIPGPLNTRPSSSSFHLSSPGFFFNSPSSNPFNFLQSPSTPKAYDYNHLGCLRPMQGTSLDQFQMQIQRQIQSNLRGDGTKSQSGTIGCSPGSAFSFYPYQ